MTITTVYATVPKQHNAVWAGKGVVVSLDLKTGVALVKMLTGEMEGSIGGFSLDKLKFKVTTHTGNTPAVRERQRIEQTIALTVAQALLAAGFLLGVNDGEEVTLKYSRDLNKVQDALFTTDEDYLLVWEDADQDDPTNAAADDDPRPNYWVHFVYGNEGWDVLADYLVPLEKYIGEGTLVQRLIDYAADHNTVLGFRA